MLSFGDGERTEVSIGPVFKRTASDTTVTGNLVAEQNPYGSGDFLQVGILTTLELEGRDRRAWPTSGYHITAAAAYYPALLDLTSSFVRAQGEVATYLSPSGGNPTLAVRLGGSHVWGTFPYSEAAFIGGVGDVRGLREQRYAGRSAAYGSAELRVALGRFTLVFPADFGVFGFGDVGRVYADDDPSDVRHNGYGGGIWIAPVMREMTARVAVAKSEGRTTFLLGMGFGF
jgi:outer membrane protein assembly factor BamA